MKLVLKVGGNEVTELSTGSSGHDSSLFDDKNDHDKHKDRKRKKRKKGEKQVPGEEKGRKRRRVKVKGVAVAPAAQVGPVPTCWPAEIRPVLRRAGPNRRNRNHLCVSAALFSYPRSCSQSTRRGSSWSPLSGAASERAFPPGKGLSRVQKSLHVGGLSEIRISKANGIY